mmetsp:Transcript_566/g.2007  ORF Transcript_566/g.2007 Transcript_566/m.2007 type:complete len:369 (-) Transcript_566:288-1394(-)|eukprot:CAMPEP_0118911138 /NCGR_PEP_ID=MMETSP1166-20130328/12966_1 /TAXON_ID=1104430 /ORGANISM="Chrysoreinhardia sp, Strain CCMP3193" /LENGTH=368 /DNA_ID=CAMNT_0006850615 /DNA_START=6 /DNA_END=1112 /DNA_ORIENTATION=+
MTLVYTARTWKFSLQELASYVVGEETVSRAAVEKAAEALFGESGLALEEETPFVGGGENSSMTRYRFTSGKSLVGKRRPASKAARRIAAIQRWYEREVYFYNEISSAFFGGEGKKKKLTPRCALATYSQLTGEFFLLLEDVQEATPWQDDHCEAAVVAMARLHDVEVPAEAPLPLTPIHLELAPLIEGYFTWAWSVVKETYPELDDRVRALVDDLCRVQGTYASLCERLAKVKNLVHGDFRPDNLFVVDGEVLVYDWQFVCLANGAYDFAYFVGLALDTDERRKREPALRRRYASERNKPFDDAAFFGTDLQVAVLLALASFVIGAATATDHDLHLNGINRLAAAAFDWDAPNALQAEEEGGAGGSRD